MIGFEKIAKTMPWVVESLLPAVSLALGALVAMGFGTKGLLVGSVFIVAFAYLLLHNRRVIGRKCFVTAITLTTGCPMVKAGLSQLTSTNQIVSKVLEFLVEALNYISTMPKDMVVALWLVTGIVAVIEMLCIDSILSDRVKLKPRKGLTILPSNTNTEGHWYYKTGKDTTGSNTRNIITFSASVTVSNFSDEFSYALVDVLRDVRVSSQFWSTLSIESKCVYIGSQILLPDNLNDVMFGRTQKPREIKINWDCKLSEMPWYVRYFKPKKLKVGFTIQDNSKDSHYIMENFRLIESGQS